MNTAIRIVIASALLLLPLLSSAQLQVEITRGVQGAIPVAIVPFGSGGPVPEDVAGIVEANLARSGRFDVVPRQQQPEQPVELNQVSTDRWRGVRADNIVVGRVVPGPQGYSVSFQLGDTHQGNQLLGFNFEVPANDLRRVAHQISDLVYEKLTGEPGAFDTRLAYVTAQRGTYSLVVSDSDGFNPQVVLRSVEPVMSPAWAPDARRLAYVSFEGKRSQIVVQDVYSGSRNVIASYPGINGAPAWAPDGRRLAFTLSRDGSPDIYVADASGQGLRRITTGSSIDTEPAWSPDGGTIYFTSDRGGGPQVYRVSSGGGNPERVTFDGDYNAAPDVGPDGRTLALVTRRGSGFHIASYDMASREMKLLSPGGLEESPSLAPNGRMIIYATGRGGLAAASVDGRVQQSLVAPGSDVREPAWSPRLR